MSDAEVFSDGSASVGVDHFFYFENVAEVESVEEERAKIAITYLRKGAFKFYFMQFIKQGQLAEKAKNYENVKEVLQKKSGKKREASTVVAYTVSLQMENHETLLQFIERASQAYEEAKFTEE